jgi:hypothetical protein
VCHAERDTCKQGSKDRIFEGFYGGVFQRVGGAANWDGPTGLAAKPESRSPGNVDREKFLTDFLRVFGEDWDHRFHVAFRSNGTNPKTSV